MRLINTPDELKIVILASTAIIVAALLVFVTYGNWKSKRHTQSPEKVKKKATKRVKRSRSR